MRPSPSEKFRPRENGGAAKKKSVFEARRAGPREALQSSGGDPAGCDNIGKGGGKESHLRQPKGSTSREAGIERPLAHRMDKGRSKSTIVNPARKRQALALCPVNTPDEMGQKRGSSLKTPRGNWGKKRREGGHIQHRGGAWADCRHRSQKKKPSGITQLQKSSTTATWKERRVLAGPANDLVTRNRYSGGPLCDGVVAFAGGPYTKKNRGKGGKGRFT